MCGIAGMTAVFPGGQLPADSSVYVRSMTDTMRYRGPDGDGLWSSDGVCLGHRRLSIIDLAGGGQPMHDAHGTLTISGKSAVSLKPKAPISSAILTRK